MPKAKLLTHKNGCGICEYYTAEPRNDYGICRRFPPVVIVDEEGASFAQPAVFADDWCGECRIRSS